MTLTALLQRPTFSVGLSILLICNKDLILGVFLKDGNWQKEWAKRTLGCPLQIVSSHLKQGVVFFWQTQNLEPVLIHRLLSVYCYCPVSCDYNFALSGLDNRRDQEL